MTQLKRFILITLTIILLLAGGFVIWASIAAQPGQAALDALISDERVLVSQTTAYIAFQPASPSTGSGQALQPSTGLIFYPGGRVNYRAYAPALRLIAEQGHLVVLVPVRLNLAFFDIEAGAPALRDFPEIEAWAAGGHSLGGVAASLFAANHPEISGVVYWASYPANDRLKEVGLKTLSIYGTQDGLATPETIQQNKSLMPADSLFHPIAGGNHAQFGDYGPQSGDLPAEISPEEQWQQIARLTAEFLEALLRK